MPTIGEPRAFCHICPARGITDSIAAGNRAELQDVRIEASADPILAVRPPAYAVSFTQRGQ